VGAVVVCSCIPCTRAGQQNSFIGTIRHVLRQPVAIFGRGIKLQQLPGYRIRSCHFPRGKPIFSFANNSGVFFANFDDPCPGPFPPFPSLFLIEQNTGDFYCDGRICIVSICICFCPVCLASPRTAAWFGGSGGLFSIGSRL
jgi:hypothetical protein